MAYTANKRLSRSFRKLCDFDPDATTAVAVEWQSMVDVGGLDGFVAGLMRSVGTGTVASFAIQVATSSTGAGATTVVSHALGSAPDAVEDQVYLECTGEQIKAALSGATHISAVIALATATDECVVLQERFGMFRQNSATTDIIA
jgi:hypothetical protein